MGDHCSGYRKTTKTLTVYLGEKPWDAPLTYFESLNLSEDMKRYTSDIEFHLIDPRKIDEADFEGFETEIGDVYRILKYRDDQFEGLLEDYMQMHNDVTVNVDGAELLNACGVEMDIKDPDNIDGKGRVLMCRSMESLMKKRLKKQRAYDIIRMMDKLGWSECQAMYYYEIPEDERTGYGALVAAARAAQTSAAPAAS